MEPVYSDAEIVCIRFLADRFEAGTPEMEEPDIADLARKFEPGRVLPILRTMEQRGMIDRAIHTSEGYYYGFRVTSEMVQTARHIERQVKEKSEPKDIVEQFRTSMRKHPIIAPILVAVFVLGFLVTVANQLVGLLRAMGVMN